MNKEEIEKIVDLFDKGYCNECNELNCLGGMPSSKKVAGAIEYLQSQLTQANSKIEKIKDLITEIIDLTLISVVVNFKEQKEKEKMLEVFKSMQNSIDKIIGEE